jgi:hypothetical protein
VDADHTGVQSSRPITLALQQVRALIEACYGYVLRLTTVTHDTHSMALWVFGKDVMRVLGPTRFALLYLAAGTDGPSRLTTTAFVVHAHDHTTSSHCAQGVLSNVAHLLYVNEIKPRIVASNPRQYAYYKMFVPDDLPRLALRLLGRALA